MKMTNDEYKKYSERHAPRSPVGPHMLWAFVVGGLICCFGQFLLNFYGAAGLDKETRKALDCAVGVLFIKSGAQSLLDDWKRESAKRRRKKAQRKEEP